MNEEKPEDIKHKKDDVIILHENSRFNKNTYDGICKFCYEVAIFRHVLFNGRNALMCTRCLNSVSMIRGHEIRNNILSHYTRYILLIRFFRRLKSYLTGGKRPYVFGFRKSLLKQLRLSK